jgi:predicted small lipoprotein YifL
MKKILAIILAVVCVVGCMTACTQKPVETNPPETTAPVVDTEPTETEPVETEPVVEPEVTEPVAVDVKLTEVFTEAQEIMGEEFRANMEIPAEMYADMFGLDASTYESVYGLIPMISAHVDTLVGVKATDVEAVQTALTAYMDAKKADRMQYPINAAAMGAMEVVTVGDYVWLVGTFGNTDSVAENGDEAILNYAKDSVAKVVNVINTVCAE